MPITDTELQEIVDSFQRLATENFNNAETTDQQNAVAKSLTLALKDFARQFRLESGQDCPPGWKPCEDGSCVPAGTDCNEVFEFLKANNFIALAATNYFNNSLSHELKDRVGELLLEAQTSFVANTELQEIVDSFQRLATENFNNAETTDQQNVVAHSLTLALKDFARQFRLESGQDCPPGWKPCEDGSCVPEGTPCNEGFEFLKANNFIALAASNYFNNSPSQELKDRVGELLLEAQASFAAKVTEASN